MVPVANADCTAEQSQQRGRGSKLGTLIETHFISRWGDYYINKVTVPEQVAKVLPIVRDKFPFSAPVIFVLYSTGLRYSHVVATRWAKLTPEGGVAIEQMYDCSENKFRPISEKRRHRR